MEVGNWPEANRIKALLEQKQRDTRRRREELAEQEGIESPEYQPIWFKKTFNELAGNSIYSYNGDYWEKKKVQDWSKCPDIFTLNEV